MSYKLTIFVIVKQSLFILCGLNRKVSELGQGGELQGPVQGGHLAR